MGASILSLYDEKTIRLSQTAKALGHPARLQIVLYLRRQSKGTAMEFIKHTGLAQATIAEHLGVLRQAGIIRGQLKKGLVIYSIAHRQVNDMKGCLEQFLQGLNRH